MTKRIRIDLEVRAILFRNRDGEEAVSRIDVAAGKTVVVGDANDGGAVASLEKIQIDEDGVFALVRLDLPFTRSLWSYGKKRHGQNSSRANVGKEKADQTQSGFKNIIY